MNKRFVLILFISAIACITFAPQANAAEMADDVRRNDLAITAGPISSTPVLTWIVELFTAISYKDYDAKNGALYGCYSLNYHYQALSWLRVGGKAVYEGSGTDYYNKDTHDLYAKHRSHWASVMASLQFTYLNKSVVKLYSGLDLGASCYMLDDKYYSVNKAGTNDLNYCFLPAFDITPIGITVGTRVYGTAEVNIGMDALVKLGLGVRF